MECIAHPEPVQTPHHSHARLASSQTAIELAVGNESSQASSKPLPVHSMGALRDPRCARSPGATRRRALAAILGLAQASQSTSPMHDINNINEMTECTTDELATIDGGGFWDDAALAVGCAASGIATGIGLIGVYVCVEVAVALGF